MALLAWLWIATQDPELERALEAERARVGAQAPLTAAERGAYAGTAALAKSNRPTRTSYRAAVVPLEFEDAKYGGAGVGEALKALTEFYRAASGGTFTLACEVRPVVTLERTRESLATLESGSREEKRVLGPGASKLEGVDGVIFIVAGGLGARGTALWPHKDTLEFSARALDYLVMPAVAGPRRDGILAHEFGHMLGLEDKYEDAAAKVDRWCLMGRGYLGDREGRPMPLCAVCRERQGWAAVWEVDHAKWAKVTLRPGEAVRIGLIDGAREALVLEMRDRLLVWHTGGAKAIELAAILPSDTSDRLTPWSDPPFRGRTIGARPVWVTDVRVQDGAGWITLGLSAPLTPLEELRRSRVGKPLGK